MYVTGNFEEDVASNGVPTSLLKRVARVGNVIVCGALTPGVGAGVGVGDGVGDGEVIGVGLGVGLGVGVGATFKVLQVPTVPNTKGDGSAYPREIIFTT